MSRVNFWLEKDPTGIEFKEFLAFFQPICTFASIETLDGELSSNGQKIINEIEKIKIATEGNKIFFPFTSKTIEICQTPAHLFGWQQPNFPSDLCLYRAADEPVLRTYSDHEEAVLSLDQDEHDLFSLKFKEMIIQAVDLADLKKKGGAEYRQALNYCLRKLNERFSKQNISARCFINTQFKLIWELDKADNGGTSEYRKALEELDNILGNEKDFEKSDLMTVSKHLTTMTKLIVR